MTKKLLSQIFDENWNEQETERKINFNKQRERIAKLLQLKNVLERDKFEGLNRKVQLKPLKWETDKTGKLTKVT
jgi:hypothetical protein